VHPTQKPVSLMAWCIAQARVPAGGVILDPWMGAGSTGVAAVMAGHPFVGIECEPVYFETALRRIEAASRQADLFAPVPADPADARMADLFAEPEFGA
jgi:site-specific DNA-methyltransferase (adenine-specific)/modification methylase